MKISKLALIALLGSALMAFGCSDDTSTPAAPLAPVAAAAAAAKVAGWRRRCRVAKQPLVSSARQRRSVASERLIGDPLRSRSTSLRYRDGAVVQGSTVTVDYLGEHSTINDLPATIDGDDHRLASTTTYEATTAGGTASPKFRYPRSRRSMGTNLNHRRW